MPRKNTHHKRKIGQKIRTTIDNIIKVLEKLRVEVSAGDCVVVVEGVGDLEALEYFGISGRVCLLRDLRRISIKPTTKLILLLDFDEEGRDMTKRVYTRLSMNGVNVDLFYYRRLSEARYLGINTIEELGRYFSKRAIQLGFDY